MSARAPSGTRILLIRHGSHDLLGRTLVGRSAGVFLSKDGLQEVEDLASALAGAGATCIYASPMERTWQTGEILAHRLSVPLHARAGLLEIDFGEWTGRSFDELHGDPEWRVWNEARTRARPPNGETIQEVQARMVEATEELRGSHAEETILIVGHADPLRTLLMHYLSIPLDLILALGLDPGSASSLVWMGAEVKVDYVNWRPTLRFQ